MARFLVITEPIAGYERGDILAVRPDGSRFGTHEDVDEWTSDQVHPDTGEPTHTAQQAETFPSPHLEIIEIPSYPCDLDLMEPLEDDYGDVLDPDTGEILYRDQELAARRAWAFDLDAIPPVTTEAEGQKRRATRANLVAKDDGRPGPNPRGNTDQTPGRGLLDGAKRPRRTLPPRGGRPEG